MAKHQYLFILLLDCSIGVALIWSANQVVDRVGQRKHAPAAEDELAATMRRPVIRG
jgi:hypothetical protein